METLGADDRRALEQAYGVDFTDDIWHELLNCLESYSIWGAVERNAAPVQELFNALDGVSAAATKLIHAMSATNEADMNFALHRTVDDEEESLFRDYERRELIYEQMTKDVAQELAQWGHDDPEGRADGIVGDWRERRYFPEPSLTDRLIDDLPRLLVSISRAKDGYTSGKRGTFKDGEAWKDHVRRLADWAGRHRYPVSARKDSDKTVGDGASAFTEFVWAVTKLAPASYQKHQHSKSALATAISRAIGNGSNKRR